ncbi:MAG: alternative ribosome rescue aminoacyl-tRNA hydrolase ArfB [Acidimicrobiales bacterium]
MGEPIVVVPGCVIDADELTWRFEPSGGPGGQHANRAHTRATVRFDIELSPSLSATQRSRLLARLGPALTVTADDERSQRRNRDLAQRRLQQRLADALYVPPPRRPTRPSRGAIRRRLEDKAQRAATKSTRRPVRPHDE